MPGRARAVVVTSVLPYPAISGGHKRTLRLIEAIARAGLVPHVLTQQAAAADALSHLRERGWTVETTPSPGPSPRDRLAQQLARRPSPYLPVVAQRVRALADGATLVQFEHTQNAYYLDAARRTRAILSLHNVDSQMLWSVARGSRGPTWLRMANRAHATAVTERRAAPRADAVITVSEADRRHFARRSTTVLCAPNGVDDEFFTVPGELPGNEDVLFFGNFDYPPNVLGIERFLIEGWPALAARRPRARLTLVGRDAPADLRARADALARVRVTGFVDSLVATLADSRVILVPLWHGGGTRLKVLESLAAARPIVATPTGVEGIGVHDGEHALLSPTPKGLADAVARALDDAELSRRIAAAGRELAERYRWPLALAPVEELYRGWREHDEARP